MPQKTIYFDESGYTGYNLLDPLQPIFVVASTDVSEATASNLLQASFPRYQGREYKFSNIWTSGHRKRLIDFCRELPELQEHVYLYVIDKRFSVLTKIVDFLIEPTFTRAGYDFYSDGFCWKYANYIHFGLAYFSPPELLESLLSQYLEFSRDPTDLRLRRLQQQLSLKANSVEEENRVFFDQMEFGARNFDLFNVRENFRSTNELQSTTMLASVAAWRQRFSDDFDVVHDASSNFMRKRLVWEKITGMGIGEQDFVLGDGSSVRFPLRVVSTIAVNSKDVVQVQFCDVLAGLAAKALGLGSNMADDGFLRAALAAGLSELTYNGIYPRSIFPDAIPPKKLIGVDKVHQMTRIIFG